MDWVVDTITLTLRGDSETWPCVIGRSGACEANDKREGDGCTPRGAWPIRAALLRPDRAFAPPSRLPWRWLREQDGWSDDPRDPAYNRPVRHPYPLSAERLWREDGCYDAIVILGHNDDPPLPGAGSAIFLHLIGKDATEGCVAVEPATMHLLLARMAHGDRLAIR